MQVSNLYLQLCLYIGQVAMAGGLYLQELLVLAALKKTVIVLSVSWYLKMTKQLRKRYNEPYQLQ